MLRRLVVVGASLAGVSAAEQLRAQGYDGELLLLSAERMLPYDRPPLSKEVLLGVGDPCDHLFRQPGRYDERDIRLELGVAASSLDLHDRTLPLNDGRRLHFDGLVIATGSAPVTLGAQSTPRVWTLRTADDAAAIRAELKDTATVVVVGGGFIGAEVAAAAAMHGCEVTIVEALPAPLHHAVGERVGLSIARLHESHGVRVRCGAVVSMIVREANSTTVELSDGGRLTADVVVVGIGARPSVQWLAGSGLELADGVVCGELCRTRAPNVVAAGDVARWQHPRLGSVRIEHGDNAVAQGGAAAAALLAPQSAPPFSPVPYVWSKQYDRLIELIGQPRGRDTLAVAHGALDDASFLALYSRRDRLSGAVGVGVPQLIGRVRQLLEGEATIAEALDTFGGEAGAAATLDAPALGPRL